ncbi:MAG: Gfo/Idh/MocA family oxidoreductase [Candidatus Poribacteria bacterium]|nr:Gfo/Idh/MocA family oxidoreductase [Candidatus Poribacteria bacterium]
MDKTYNVAIIGCGGISHMHAGWYVNEPRASLTAIADINAAGLKAYGEQYGVEKQYTDYIEMLETEEIDLVSVCTRPKLHAPVVIETAKRGVKGILSEKPMAENLGQAREMLETCSQHDVKLAIDHQVRFSAPYQLARQMIADGAIGDLFRIHGVCSGGDLKDNATHTVDLMRYVYSDRSVTWVIGQIERINTPMKYDLHSEDFSLGYFKFEDNVRAIIEGGSDTAPGYHHIYCYGTEGELELAAPGGPSLRVRNTASGCAWIAPELPSESNPVRDMIAAIEEDREHRSSGYQGYATHELLMAIYESSRKRRRIHLPLEEMESPLTLMIEDGWI